MTSESVKNTPNQLTLSPRSRRMAMKTVCAPRYATIVVTTPCESGVPVRCTHAAQPPPSTKPNIAPKKKKALSPAESESSKAAISVSGIARSRQTPIPARTACRSQRPGFDVWFTATTRRRTAWGVRACRGS
jgi:hypothetical protein